MVFTGKGGNEGGYTLTPDVNNKLITHSGQNTVVPLKIINTCESFPNLVLRW